MLGNIFRFGWDLRTFMEVTCATMDDFMTFVLRTCRAPDAILGHIPFRRIFMDLRRGHMFEDKWFHAIWSSTYHTFRCHTGAYFGSDEIYRSWGSRVLIPIWRDVCRGWYIRYPHDDSLVEPIESHLVRSALLDAWMLSCFLPRDAPLIYGSDSVVYMDDLDRAFDDGWFELIWFF